MSDFSSTEYMAILLSAKVATAATAVSLPFGIAAAYLLSWRNFRGKIIAETIISLPLSLPPVVIGYLLLLLLGNNGWLAPVLNFFGVRILFTWKAAVIASMVVGFPLMVRSIRIAMEGIDQRLVDASRTLGASWCDSLFSVILPLSWPGIAAGSSLMFARSLGEFGATIIVAGNIPGVTQTIPLAIYDYAAAPGGEAMAGTLCIVSVVMSVGILLLHDHFGRKYRKRNGQ